MFSQSFGNYLLNNNYLTKDEVLKALEITGETHVKIGVLAINSGKISPKQVEEITDEQKRSDKRFGEIAIDKGYISANELDQMLSQQKGHLVLMQAILDLDYMSMEEIDKVLKEYTEKYHINTSNTNGVLEEIIRSYTGDNNFHFEYVYLMMKNINRFMDSVVVLGDSTVIKKYDVPIISQEIRGEEAAKTYIVLSRGALNHAVAVLNKDGLDIEDNEILEEFLNLHNGLFIVNKSNNGIDCDLEPVRTLDNEQIKGKVYTLYSNQGFVNIIID